MTDAELIDAITGTRKENNLNWMALLRLAFRVAPDEARMIVREIVDCDERVTRYAKQLATEPERR